MKKILIGVLVFLFPIMLFSEYRTDNFQAIALIGSDVILATVATCVYLDYSNSASAYEILYNSLNKTDISNYNILVYEKKQVEQKGINTAVMLGLAGVAIIYTLEDAFLFHNVFEMPVKVNINPARQYAGIEKEWRF
ncbi:MAG: hypothetical protein WCJ94_03495 [bacterium]